MLACMLAALIVVGSPATVATAPPPAPLRPAISQELAQSMRLKILELERRGRLPRTAKAARPAPMSFTQGELNSYINLVLRPRLPPGLYAVDFQLGPRIEARGQLDLEKVKAAMQVNSMWNPLSLLSGTV